MPRIVSGVREEFDDPGLAFLAGYERATQRGKEQRAAAMDQMRFGLQIQQAQQEYEQEKAKALADVNARVQMGDVQAQIQQAMEAEAANQPPDQKWYQEYVGVGQRINDPKARAAWEKFAGEYKGQLDQETKKKAALEAIDEAVKNGTIAARDDYVNRVASGEETDNITKELGILKEKKMIEGLALKKNAEARAQAEAYIQTMQPGPERLQAEADLERFDQDMVAQSKPHTGPALLRKVTGYGIEYQERSAREQILREKALRARQKDIAGSQRRRREHYSDLTKQDDADVDQIAQRRYGVSPDTLDFTGGSAAGGDTSLAATAHGKAAPDGYKKPGSLVQSAGRMKAEKEKRYPGSTKEVQGPPLPPNMTAGGQIPGEVLMRTTTQAVKDVAGIEDDAERTRALLTKLQEQGVKLTPRNIQVAKKALQEAQNYARQSGAADR